HVYDNIDPKRDIEIINTELLLADLEVVEKRFKKLEKQAQTTGQKELKLEVQVLKVVLDLLKADTPLRSKQWDREDLQYILPLNLITLKPILYICNQSEDAFKEGNLAEKQIQEMCRNQEEVLSISCALEEEMVDLNPQEKQEFLSALGMKEPSLNRVIRKVYEQLNLITFFTAGKKEVKAWTLPKGSLAPQAAGVIHSDFEKGFIRAEVYSFEDLLKYRTEKDLKQAGRMISEGKNYEVKDGDIMHFLFNV
ncbi:MAG: DUF933 domain-containing protein, partial [Bdellovibrionales bacterium]